MKFALVNKILLTLGRLAVFMLLLNTMLFLIPHLDLHRFSHHAQQHFSINSPAVSAAFQQELADYFNLQRSLVWQWGAQLKRTLSFDLGYSLFMYPARVTQILSQPLRNTALSLGGSLGLAWVLGSGAGVLLFRLNSVFLRSLFKIMQMFSYLPSLVYGLLFSTAVQLQYSWQYLLFATLTLSFYPLMQQASSAHKYLNGQLNSPSAQYAQLMGVDFRHFALDYLPRMAAPQLAHLLKTVPLVVLNLLALDVFCMKLGLTQTLAIFVQHRDVAVLQSVVYLVALTALALLYFNKLISKVAELIRHD